MNAREWARRTPASRGAAAAFVAGWPFALCVAWAGPPWALAGWAACWVTALALGLAVHRMEDSPEWRRIRARDEQKARR